VDIMAPGKFIIDNTIGSFDWFKGRIGKSYFSDTQQVLIGKSGNLNVFTQYGSLSYNLNNTGVINFYDPKFYFFGSYFKNDGLLKFFQSTVFTTSNFTEPTESPTQVPTESPTRPPNNFPSTFTTSPTIVSVSPTEEPTESPILSFTPTFSNYGQITASNGTIISIDIKFINIGKLRILVFNETSYGQYLFTQGAQFSGSAFIAFDIRSSFNFNTTTGQLGECFPAVITLPQDFSPTSNGYFTRIHDTSRSLYVAYQFEVASLETSYLSALATGHFESGFIYGVSNSSLLRNQSFSFTNKTLPFCTALLGPRKSGLSAGQIAGIAVGAAVGGILILLILILLIFVIMGGGGIENI